MSRILARAEEGKVGAAKQIQSACLTSSFDVT
jgi:hypothetical protein